MSGLGDVVVLGLGLIGGAVVAAVVVHHPRANRTPAHGVRQDLLAFVDGYTFPPAMLQRVQRAFPSAPLAEVEAGLRQFLFAVGRAPGFAAGMPSRVIDEAWHTFITYTRDYAEFCDAAYGRYLHHVPEDTMSAESVYANRTVATVWAWDGACLAEGLDPTTTERAPVLFRVDALAGLEGATAVPRATCGHEPCATSPPSVCVHHQLRPAFAASAGAAGWVAGGCGAGGGGCGSVGCGASGCGSS